MPKQLLPIGRQSFKDLRESNCVYVDKTKHIFELVNSSKYMFLSRPRRFGKSLLIDTIKQLFEGRKELFQDLWIENNWDFETKNPVIKISFGSGVLTSKDMENTIGDIFREHEEKYEISLGNQGISGRFRELILTLEKKYKQNVVVLIDEYDKPILDSIDTPEQALEVRDALRDFYGTLKDADEFLRFVMLTGVSKFSKVSLFSGLNNLEDISLNSIFGSICGITEEEITENFQEYLEGVDRKKLRKWYNGYNFLGKEKVYNPFDLLLFFKNKEYQNYWFESATPTFLIKKLQERKFYIPDIEHLEVGGEIVGSFDLKNLSVETLLFQAGYLTVRERKKIGSKDLYILQYPNLEVKASLSDSILTSLVHDPIAKQKNQTSIYRSLEAGNIEKLEETFRQIFASIPHDWYRKNNISEYEGYYCSVVYSYLYGLGLDIIAEDTTSKGRIDLTIRLNGRIFILEFKVEKTGKNALEQIKEKGYAEKYSGEKEVYLIGIEFDEEERNVKSFEWEEVNK